MDKEGQSIQFSSDAISEKKKPDFFIASNEKAARRERFSIKTIFAKIGRFFKKLGVKFVGYTKHPFRGKHKILTISLFVVIVVAVVLIVLNLTIWQKTAKDTTPLSDDDDMKSFYTNHINDEKREYKALDLTLDYARMLSTKGFVDDAAAILNALDTDDLSCRQMIEYYAGFFSIYDMINNGSWSSELDYYADLIDNQISICDTGEPLPVEDATVEEAQNEE